MPLIAYRDKRKKISFQADILEEIDEQIKEYCKWSGVTDLGYFLEEATKYILAKDELWKKHIKDQSEAALAH